MRTTFVQTLESLMTKHDDILAVTADMGFSVFENVRDHFPKRYLNTGVTEQASIGVVTGLALSGYKVFFYAQAAFATMRCLEQIRLDVAYGRTNVKIVGVAAGFSLNQLGVSHFATEDVNVMRGFPGMTVLTPGDPVEADWATKTAYQQDGPFYIRLTEAGCPVIHSKPLKAKIGEALRLSQGKDAALFVSGSLLPLAQHVVEHLAKKQNLHLSLISMPTIKPLDKKTVLERAKKTRHIFTLEEHNIIGGLGSAVAEVMAESGIPAVLHRFGVLDIFTSYTGSIEYLLKSNKLSFAYVCDTIKRKLAK